MSGWDLKSVSRLALLGTRLQLAQLQGLGRVALVELTSVLALDSVASEGYARAELQAYSEDFYNGAAFGSGFRLVWKQTKAKATSILRAQMPDEDRGYVTKTVQP